MTGSDVVVKTLTETTETLGLGKLTVELSADKAVQIYVDHIEKKCKEVGICERNIVTSVENNVNDINKGVKFMKKVINTAMAPQAIGPYSQAIKANGFLFVSGQIPLDPVSGQLAYGGIEVQTHQVLKNLNAILESEGLTFADVVKTSVFLQDMDDFAVVNEVYAQYFKTEPPARACVQVARLPRNVGVEIELIAAYK